MKLSQLAKIGIIVGGIGIMIVPILTHNHIYKVIMAQSDLPFHSDVIQSFTNGQPLQSIRYLGEVIFGWILGTMNGLLHLDPQLLFLLFMFISLFTICLTLYYFGKLAGGQLTAWFVLIIGGLSTTSILTHISWGTIYNAINMYLILPWAVILFAIWYTRRKLLYLFGGLSLLLIFSAFHLSSLYLPYTIGAFLAGLAVWFIVKRKRKREIILYGGIALLALALNIVISLWAFHPEAVLSLNESGKTNMGIIITPVNIGQFVYRFFETYLRASTTVIGIIVLGCLIYYKKTIVFSPVVKAVLAMLTSLVLALTGSVALNFAYDLKRQAIDAAGIIAIIVALLLGELFKVKSLDWKLKTVCYSIMAVGSFNTLWVWVMP